jgi:hypothetical protein
METDGFSVPSSAQILAGRRDQYWRTVEQFEEMSPRQLSPFPAWWGGAFEVLEEERDI